MPLKTAEKVPVLEPGYHALRATIESTFEPQVVLTHREPSYLLNTWMKRRLKQQQTFRE